MSEVNLSEKGAKALAFLQANIGEYTVNELAEALDLEPKGIHGVMRPLVSNGLVYKETRDVPYLGKNPDGTPKEVVRETKTYAATKDGQDYEIV